MKKILNENAIDVLDRMIDKEFKVDLIITDPPYKTTKRGNSGETGGMLKDKKFINGNGGFSNNDINQLEWIEKCYKVLKDDCHIYIMTNNKNLLQTLLDIKSVGFKVFKTLIWAKDNCITNMWYMDSHEYIIFARKGKAKKINNCGDRSVFNIPNVKNKKHPSQKPVELFEKLVLNSSSENDIVLDPFCGVGTLPIACINNNRNYIGIELDYDYFNIASESVKKAKKSDFFND
jgi:site-specific DNA-methyltransferase (adenine-specific)